MLSSLRSEKIKVICPECHHYIYGTRRPDGAIVSHCKNCQTISYSKIHTKKKEPEKIIKIVKYN